MLLFAIGLLASIPLAVLANLLTPRIQTTIVGRNKKHQHKRIVKIRKEIAKVERYRTGTHGELLAYCAHQVVYCVMQFSLIVVVDVTVMAGLAVGSFTNTESNCITLLAMIVTLLLLFDALRDATCPFSRRSIVLTNIEQQRPRS